MKVRFTPEARSDLRAIFDYIAAGSPENADRFVSDLETRCFRIALEPEIAPPRFDLAEGLRMVVFGQYLIFYVIAGGVIEIVRVVHGSRNLARLF